MEAYSLPIDFTEPDLAPIPAFSIAESVQTGKSLFALGGFVTNRDTGKQHWVTNYGLLWACQHRQGEGPVLTAGTVESSVGRSALSRLEPVWVHSACVSTLLRPN